MGCSTMGATNLKSRTHTVPDLGSAIDFPVHRQISHPRGVWHLEGLTNLAALPPTGIWLFVGVLNLQDGSGSPARVLALVP